MASTKSGSDRTGSRIGSPYKDRLNRSQKSKVVYKASCWDCDAFYIGKTKRRLHDRRIEHFKALTQVGHASAVVSHAISTGHNIIWDHFEALASGRCDLHCKIKAPLFIRDLKSTLNDNASSEKVSCHFTSYHLLFSLLFS